MQRDLVLNCWSFAGLACLSEARAVGELRWPLEQAQTLDAVVVDDATSRARIVD